jgi:hypothetical protein
MKDLLVLLPTPNCDAKNSLEADPRDPMWAGDR